MLAFLSLLAFMLIPLPWFVYCPDDCPDYQGNRALKGWLFPAHVFNVLRLLVGSFAVCLALSLLGIHLNQSEAKKKPKAPRLHILDGPVLYL